MPLVLSLVLLLGLSARRGWGCLQCDQSVREALRQLRLAIVPSHFRLGHHGSRAQALLLGMEGPFFRDYAVNAFVGQVETDRLDLVASFVKNQIKNLEDEPLLKELVALRTRVLKELKTALSSYELKACNHEICHMLQEEVLDCSHCLKISPKCIKQEHCFVDRQPRVALKYEEKSGYPENQVLLGIIVSVCLAASAFGVIVVSAITYRQNRKLVLQ